LLWGNWFPCFFCLPIIALGVVIVPILCAIKYFLAVIIALVIFRMEGLRRWKAKKLNEKGKTNNQVAKNKNKTKKQTKNFQRYKQGETVY
jgi:prepilin signal peptidase PulO-like enzyme (type II secretory pathway)